MNYKLTLITSLLSILLFSNMETSWAQTSTSGANYISTAVPFLTITPDSRAGAMGDVGVATSPDANSMHWNPAKFAMIDGNYGVAASYTPWLRDLVDDMSLAYLTGYYRLDKNQVLASSLRYFTLGEIIFLESENATPVSRNPNEWAFDIAYSRRLTDNLSGAIAFRYIRSDLTQSQYVAGVETQAGNAYSADISVYYQKEFKRNRKEILWSWGLNISNIGSKISYTTDDEKEFIPTNLRLGSALKFELDNYNSLTVAADFNKLLVPTPANGSLQDGEDNGTVIVGGQASNKSVMSGIFGSFSDAPGGMSEEFKEITWSLGLEYWYQKQFALRTGYYYEHEEKGNRKYFTAGLGVKLNMFDLDFSYLIPSTQNNPLKNTLRFTLTANIDKIIK
ncbi:type IX secretion system outer membrane channel protein PorV [Labilibaculum euxinus]|uniref:Type IX secretion system outer membrane channel protein PorV n=1 Tax=Labilibaculum euxinus TaxID=2686357 RepID=A0A7M4D0U0_9BACT|nr:type IX secretion system outer membrane channel protein PorV [Labilibaculum euxinus]MUP36269.1 type IX secretion system outer membrane channel protein PorV [Labilibaculum euxinus]MVB05474.1 type IX secretion system outer membrane channel protein PorV [Labilibaculum euxinus]